MVEWERYAIRVEGVVQGVGFRPFVRRLALRFDLDGWVGNDAQGVFVEAEGGSSALTSFRAALLAEKPPLAVVERLTVTPIEPVGGRCRVGPAQFAILPSVADGERRTLVSPDLATCDDCLREILDPADPRHGYAFTNCTACGPRFTIVRDVPYDRGATTMAGFEMCGRCAKEYADPDDRRFHAQPTCCPACGPRLRFVDTAGNEAEGADAVPAAASSLAAGQVVAVKGLGGYHLAVDAAREAAVAALRARKHREERAFAVMVADLAAARELCEVDDAEAVLLTAPRRPIVLLRRRSAPPNLARSVAPGNRFLGLMLPYTPLHHLLLREFAGPLVMTSGNLSDEPIAYRDEDALARLSGIADAFLTHDRDIHTRVDDSVVRVFRGRELPVRRSRGYAPHPVTVPGRVARPVLACGAELKNTFCLAKGTHAFLSPHIGDLENYETLRSFTEGIEHFKRLFDIVPALVAHDLHPEYLSTKYALDLDAELVGVQHHHAHIASCLADNQEWGPVIGVAFDGLGYGLDGTLWGGEIMVADLAEFRRVGHLEPLPMPGGVTAIRQPWRMAAAHLDAAYAGTPPDDLPVRLRHPDWPDVVAVARSGIGAPLTSSAGRLFDAAAAIIGVRDKVTYEGQAAIELEQLADPAELTAYPARLTRASAQAAQPFRIQGGDLIRAVAEDLARGAAAPIVAARFHNGVAGAVVAAATTVRESCGLSAVALSGGVFQNRLLLARTVDGLAGAGFRVLTHSRVPPNDGGVSLGQAVIAAARDRSPDGPAPVFAWAAQSGGR